MTLTLGIDIGTSGVRTAVLDGYDPISMARASHPEQDPDNIDANGWWQAVEQCLHAQVKALKELGRDPKDISGIAVDGTSGSMVLTDAEVNPVSPGLMYNSKGFLAEADRIASVAPASHITQGSNSALGRAMRLVSLCDGSPAHLLHQADFIAAKLMGVGGYSDFNNTLKTGFDPETESWPDWIGQVIDPLLLPIVRAPGNAIKPVSETMAKTFGFSDQTLVHAGTTDSIAAFLACAPLEEGVAVTSLGSTMAIKLLSAKRVDDLAAGLYSHRLGNLWLVGGASNTGGAVLKTFFSDDKLKTLSAQIDPSKPQNLDYYPLKEPGERFPINDPYLQPRLTPRPANDAKFLQALFEGMANIEARSYVAIAREGGPRPSRVITAGGGAVNEVWTAIRARALGLVPSMAEQTEAAIGVARIARP